MSGRSWVLTTAIQQMWVLKVQMLGCRHENLDLDAEAAAAERVMYWTSMLQDWGSSQIWNSCEHFL